MRKLNLHWFCTQNHILEPFSVRRACTQCYVTSEPYPRPSQIWCQNVRETQKKIVIKCRGESFARYRVIARYVEGGAIMAPPPSLIRVKEHCACRLNFTNCRTKMLKWMTKWPRIEMFPKLCCQYQNINEWISPELQIILDWYSTRNTIAYGWKICIFVKLVTDRVSISEALYQISFSAILGVSFCSISKTLIACRAMHLIYFKPETVIHNCHITIIPCRKESAAARARQNELPCSWGVSVHASCFSSLRCSQWCTGYSVGTGSVDQVNKKALWFINVLGITWKVCRSHRIFTRPRVKAMHNNKVSA